jgi:dTDP-4-dehydrorhamnose reductase
MITLDNDILVLGHTGLLGDCVVKYFNSNGISVQVINFRYPSIEFFNSIKSFSGIVINCIAELHDESKFNINYDLPTFLHNNFKLIHPCSDAVYSGNILPEYTYNKFSIINPSNYYGESKAKFFSNINNPSNVRVIRSSIIGFDKHNTSLLSWFLSSKNECAGYSNYFWNGITALEWAKCSFNLCLNFNTTPLLTMLSSDLIISKYDLLNIFKLVYKKPINIIQSTIKDTKNYSIESDIKLDSIYNQLLSYNLLYTNPQLIL